MKSITLLVFSLLAFSFTSRSQYLDQTFNSTGYVVSPPNDSRANAMLILADSTILTAGKYGSQALLTKYLPDGTIDNSFGTAGVTTAIFGTGNSSFASIALQSDGKIVCAGSLHNSSADILVIARYNADGMPDATFGVNGIVVPPLMSATNGVNSVCVQADGKIVALGSNQYNSFTHITIIRYTTDGIADTSFNHTGMVTDSSTQWVPRTLAIQPDGKIIAGAGSSYSNAVCLERYNADGTIDHTFGNLGSTVMNSFFPLAVSLNSMTLQPDGKIVLGGIFTHHGGLDSYYDRDYFAIMRFNEDGSADNGFGAGHGYSQVDISGINDDCYGIALQPDGMIVAAGQTNMGLYATNQPSHIALARLTPDGVLDATFNGNGLLIADVTSNDGARATAIDAVGRILTAGFTHSSGYDQGLVARFNDGFPASVHQAIQRRSNTTIYPVPLINTTTIQYELQSPGAVTVNMYDITGRRIKNILNNTQQQIGIHKQQCATADLAKGVYTIKVISDEGVETVEVVK